MMLSVFIGLCVIEFAARHKFSGDLWLIRNPDHHLKPNTKDTNSDGIRSDREASEFTPNGLNIVILGDSFVYGYNMYPHLAFPQQFERLIHTRHPMLESKVANFGWTSSSPYLSLRKLKQIGMKYNPDIVILCIDMTDFNDDLKYKHLIERDLLLYKGLSICPGLITFTKKILSRYKCDRLHELMFGLPRDRFFAVNQPLHETRSWFVATLEAVEQIHQYVRDELNAHFVLVLLPRSFQYSDRECPMNWERNMYEVLGSHSREPFVFFENLRSTVDYPIHSLLGVFESSGVFPHCEYKDPHWNREGNAIAAKAIYDVVVEEGMLPKARRPEQERSSYK